MIQYTNGAWGLMLIFQISGSVFPKGLAWAVPSALLAGLLHYLARSDIIQSEALSNWQEEDSDLGSGIPMGVTGFYSVMGFLIVFRTQQAYARWWEGGTLLQTVRGEWFNAYSQLLAFSNRDPSMVGSVRSFQHLLLRLMSLLYCAALQQVSTSEASRFEIINLEGMEVQRLEFLQASKDRCEIILHWIQRLIVSAKEERICNVEAPLLAMVFQQLSRGIVNIDDARKIREFPFPFPYAQMMTLMLVIHWAITPVLMSLMCHHAWWASVLTFVQVFALWSLNYVATAIESPFGDDENDLPLVDMQQEFNNSLATLLMKEAEHPPAFNFSRQAHESVKIQEVDHIGIADPSFLQENDPRSERVLRVLRQLSTDLSMEQAAVELPGLVQRKSTRRLTISGRSRRRRRAPSGDSMGTMATTVAESVFFNERALSQSLDMPGIAVAAPDAAPAALGVSVVMGDGAALENPGSPLMDSGKSASDLPSTEHGRTVTFQRPRASTGGGFRTPCRIPDNHSSSPHSGSISLK